MSTRSLKTKKIELPTTPAHLQSLQQLVLRWGWKVTKRKDVIPTIVPTHLGINLGAPAVFVPATAQVLVPEAAFDHLDASQIESIDQFIVEHPRKAGRFVHEFLHAAHSPGLRFLDGFAKAHDHKHMDALTTLLEGHCETQGWENLRPIEQNALSEVVFEVVLEDLVPEDGSDIDFKSPQVAANLLGLIAARVNMGIIDVTEPKANAVYVNTVAALGEYYSDFWDVAIQFSETPVGWNTDYEIKMADLVQTWVDLLDSFVLANTPEEEEEPEQPEGGEKGEEGEEPSGQPGGESEEESEEPGPGGQDEEEGDEDGGTGNGGGEEGEEEGGTGNGGGTPLGTEEGGTGGGFGAYAHAHQPDLPSFDPSALEDAVKNLEEADREAKHNSEAMIRIHVAEVHEATANWHAQRRAWNKEQERQWH